MKSLLEIPKTVVYSDVNPDVLEDTPYELVFNEDVIRKSLDTIFTTPYGSRVFRRRFGSKILDLLYEPVDNTTAEKVRSMILSTALAWETRITGLEIVVLPDVANQQYYVDLRYSIKDLGNKMVQYKFNISK